MRSITLLSITLILFSALVADANAQQLGRSHAFHIRVPQGIETSKLSIRYFLTGPFGGYGSTIEARSNVSDYSIELSVNKKPAQTLKAIIYCPGYQMAIINIPSLAGSKESGEEVQLKPAPLTSLSGKIMLPAHWPAQDVEMTIRYQAYWSHQFFGITDGLVDSFHIAVVRVAKDGSFATELPDLTLDPVINSFAMNGEFILTAQDPQTGTWLTFEPAENRGDFHGLKPASQYLYGLIFKPL